MTGWKMLGFAALMVSLAAGESALRAENWPQWRGPHNNGVSAETGIAVEWSPTKNVAWRLPLPGPGGATPVVWGDRIFVTTADGPEDGASLSLLCVTTDGKELWRKQVGAGNQNARTSEGNSASPSPCTDGQHVWVFFGTGALACYDRDGGEVWKFDVQKRYGKFDIQFGLTSTPVLHGDALYLQLIHGAMRDDYTVGKVVKLDKATGEEIWAVDRPSQAEFECKHSYASPFLYDDGECRFLLTHGADRTVAHDLETGREIARLTGLNGPTKLNSKQNDPTFRFVASPGFAPGLVVVPTAKGGPAIAINVKEGVEGDLAANPEAVRWVNEKTPDVSIPLIVDGLVYLVHKDGRINCVEAATGREHYFERTHSAEHRASPVYADGRLYLCARDGRCTVVKAGKAFEIVASNDLNEPITASPVVADGTLYLRTYEALYAIRGR